MKKNSTIKPIKKMFVKKPLITNLKSNSPNLSSYNSTSNSLSPKIKTNNNNNNNHLNSPISTINISTNNTKLNSKDVLILNLKEENKKLKNENEKLKNTLNQIKNDLNNLNEYILIHPNEMLIEQNNKLIDENKKLNNNFKNFCDKINFIHNKLNSIEIKVYTFDDEGNLNQSKISDLNDNNFFNNFKKEFNIFLNEISKENKNYSECLKSTLNSFNFFMDKIIFNFDNILNSYFNNNNNKEIFKKFLENCILNLYYEKIIFELFNFVYYDNKKIIFYQNLCEMLINLGLNLNDNKNFNDVKNLINNFDKTYNNFIDNFNKENYFKLEQYISMLKSIIKNFNLNNNNNNNDNNNNTTSIIDNNSEFNENIDGKINKIPFINNNTKLNKKKTEFSNCSSINKDSFYGYIQNEPTINFDEEDSQFK